MGLGVMATAAAGSLDESEGCRRFGISDAVILMVDVAVALSGSLSLWWLMIGKFADFCWSASAHAGALLERPWWFWAETRDDLRNTFWYGFQGAEHLVFSFTPAWVVVRLRRPRPSWRGLLWQPGAVAALAVVFGFCWGTGSLVTLLPGRFDAMNAMPSAIGGSVALAWVALASSRRWRAEPGWIDRSGRLLGCLALGLAVSLPLIWRI